MVYPIGENQSCEAKDWIRQSQPLAGQDAVFRASLIIQSEFQGNIGQKKYMCVSRYMKF